jgi:hypothetical protein
MTTHQSRNLDDVSHNNDGPERRRVPRLGVASEQFRLKQNGKIFSVADLSEDGMGLRVIDRTDICLFPVGSVIEGTLNLHRVKHPVRAQIVRLDGDHVGCRFQELSQETQAALLSFLEPAVLGRELKPIPSSAGDGGTLWYHGPSGTDLLLWRSMDGQFKRFSLFTQGGFVQWEEETGLSTGQSENSDEQDEIRGVIRFETMLLKADEKPDPEKLSIAKKIILSSNLPQDLKGWCARKLK